MRCRSWRGNQVMNARIIGALLIVTLHYGLGVPSAVAQTSVHAEEAADAEPPPDPLAPFNERVFWFNLKLDDYALKPVAGAYNNVMPDGGKRAIGRFLRNLGIAERLANNLFQLKIIRAGQELGRFVVNTTVGGLGFFDVAESWLGWEAHHEDFGQTLGHYGIGTGPYLMLPFYGPSSVRDTAGLVADGFLNPMNYFLSTLTVFAIKGGITGATAINYRALNMDFFADVQRSTVDLYGAVQDGYLQRREQQVKE